MYCSPPGYSVHGDSLGKNIGVSGHALLQGIFPTQGSNLDLSHGSQILYKPPWKPRWIQIQTRFCCCSVAQLCLTLCDSLGCKWQASLSITNSWSLLKLMSIESVMPPNHLVFCHPLVLLRSFFPSISVFSKESALRIRWPKNWSFSFSISPSSKYSGLISFRIDSLISLLFKGLSRIFSNTTV